MTGIINASKGFGKMYFDLFIDGKLSLKAILLLTYLMDKMEYSTPKREDGFFRVSDSFINECLKWSKNTIRKYLKELEEAGYITVEIDRASTGELVRWVKLNAKVE